MMPTNSICGGWPHIGGDIMEHYGCNNLENHPESTVHNSTYNWNGGIPPHPTMHTYLQQLLNFMNMK